MEDMGEGATVHVENITVRFQNMGVQSKSQGINAEVLRTNGLSQKL